MPNIESKLEDRLEETSDTLSDILDDCNDALSQKGASGTANNLMGVPGLINSIPSGTGPDAYLKTVLVNSENTAATFTKQDDSTVEFKPVSDWNAQSQGEGGFIINKPFDVASSYTKTGNLDNSGSATISDGSIINVGDTVIFNVEGTEVLSGVAASFDPTGLGREYVGIHNDDFSIIAAYIPYTKEIKLVDPDGSSNAFSLIVNSVSKLSADKINIGKGLHVDNSALNGYMLVTFGEDESGNHYEPDIAFSDMYNAFMNGINIMGTKNDADGYFPCTFISDETGETVTGSFMKVINLHNDTTGTSQYVLKGLTYIGDNLWDDVSLPMSSLIQNPAANFGSLEVGSHTQGTYSYKATVNSQGDVTYSWVKD